MDLFDRIKTGKPVGGRQVISHVGGSRRGQVFRVRCLGLPGHECGSETNMNAYDLKAGRAKRCLSCARILRERKRHTPVGAEFAAARKRRAAGLARGSHEAR